jgi:hypothetical protein
MPLGSTRLPSHSEPRSHYVHLLPRRLNPLLGLLLKSMENVDGLWKADGVHGAKRPPIEVLDDFKETSTHEAQMIGLETPPFTVEVSYISDTQSNGFACAAWLDSANMGWLQECSWPDAAPAA